MPPKLLKIQRNLKIHYRKKIPTCFFLLHHFYICLTKIRLTGVITEGHMVLWTPISYFSTFVINGWWFEETICPQELHTFNKVTIIESFPRPGPDVPCEADTWAWPCISFSGLWESLGLDEQHLPSASNAIPGLQHYNTTQYQYICHSNYS